MIVLARRRRVTYSSFLVFFCHACCKYRHDSLSFNVCVFFRPGPVVQFFSLFFTFFGFTDLLSPPRPVFSRSSFYFPPLLFPVRLSRQRQSQRSPPPFSSASSLFIASLIFSACSVCLVVGARRCKESNIHHRVEPTRTTFIE